MKVHNIRVGPASLLFVIMSTSGVVNYSKLKWRSSKTSILVYLFFDIVFFNFPVERSFRNSQLMGGIFSFAFML
jgi:hypothetical protein